MFMFDPANFGTPLAMLQIPGRAIQRIREKLAGDPDCTLTYYSQDCRHFSELRKVVAADDVSAARRASVDVGYICRRCQIVYPGRSTCASHQEAVCYRDAASGSGGVSGSAIPAGSIVKLEQMQYECAACRGNLRFSTAAEYKSHCGQDAHRTATSAWLRAHHSQSRPSSSAVARPPSDAPGSAPAGASTPLPSARDSSGK
jgi:AT-binding transcription factor 1